ncbi:efflux RND transporter permease subunit [Alkanindiges sp. WGS2144]|uniref:efflux RND transporter permease subunit n=1 Tax=Alkanindiges sp. WGS2144 TaxID=3366808 RepID=UPI00375144FE
MWLTRISVNNPVFTAMLMLALMVMGLASWQRMTVEEFPDVDFPFVVVYTTYPGASPEMVESDVTKKLEDSINTISGVKQVISTSSEGLSTVIVEFNLDVPSSLAAQDVRDKVAIVQPELRDEVEDPLIQRYNPSDAPVISAIFRSDRMSMRDLSNYLDQRIIPQLRTISGVGNVNMLGDVKRQIRVEVQPEKMQALGISVDQVIGVLRSENMQLPSGTLKNGNQELVVEIKGRLVNPIDFNQLIVARRGNMPVYLSQIATVTDSQAEAETGAFFNGNRAVSLDVLKTSEANVIEVVDQTKATLEKIRQQLPPDVTFTLSSDRAKSIRASITDVVKTLIEGGVLAILIVLLFLGSWRSTIITGLTLPISLLGTLTVLWAFGFSINLMTLMALSLCIGLLIDDAIVVRENIVRHAAMGKDHKQAALDGTKEIGLAVLATTLTIVAVFLPVAFMGGIIGRFFYQFGVAVSSAVLISMFVSLTLDPMLSAIWPEKHTPEAKKSRFQRFLDHCAAAIDRLNGIYTTILKFCLHFRLLTLGIAVLSLVAAFGLAGMIGKEFVPTPDMGELKVQFETPVDSTLQYTEAKVKQLDQLLRDFPEVITTYGSINSVGNAGRNRAVLRVSLKPKHERERSLNELINAIRNRVQDVAGITLTSVSADDDSISGGLKPIMISITGPELDELQKLSDQFMQKMQDIPGIVDLRSSLAEPKPTLAVHLNRAAASDLGLSVGQISQALRPLLAGDNITTWQDPNGENYDVNIRLPETQRQSIEQLQNLYFSSTNTAISNGQQANLIPLSQIASFEQTLGASQINRRNLFREVLIDANTSGRPAGDIGEDIKRIQQDMKLPPGYQFQTEGANKDMEESVGYAVTALILAVLFIYMVLGSQFNSFLHPVTIMASLPLSLIGVFLALFLFNSTLNIFSIIGIIMLMGLVTKNAILLIDFIKKAVEKGVPRNEAIIQSGQTRLRPILMTTSAMIMGMVPLALGLGEGAEQRAPMAHAIIGGVITSTLLTLVVVPVIYTYLDDLANWSVRQVRKIRKTS